jgi:integrase
MRADADKGEQRAATYEAQAKAANHPDTRKKLFERARLARAQYAGPFLFPSPRVEDKPLGNVRRLWVAVRDEAKLKGVRLHDLRHSFASIGASAGLTLQMVGKLLGHEQITTTQRYVHLFDKDQRDATARTGKIIEAVEKGKKAQILKFPRGRG